MSNAPIDVDFLWVPPHLGGHRGAPYTGMRLQVRWQHHVKDWLDRIWDVECVTLSFVEATGEGRGTFRFTSPDPLPDGWLQVGEPLEMLNGHRVLAVGKIVGTAR